MRECSMWCLATKLFVFFVVVKMILILILHSNSPNLFNELQYQHIGLYLSVLITWFLLLAWLCSSCNQNLSLVFLLVPFIICFVFMISIFSLLIRIHNRL